MGPRRYLTGLDWIIHALDSATRRVSTTGNHSQVVLELDGNLDPQYLDAELQRFAANLPVLNGKVARRWTLEPFWKIPADSRPASLRLQVHRVKEDQAFEVLQQCVNTPFRSNQEYVTFHYLHISEQSSLLALVFDHRLLDARGAEQFLSLFSRYVRGEVSQEQLQKIAAPAQPSLLSRWGERFLSGRCMLRSTRSFADCEIASLSKNDAGETKFVHLALDEEMSRSLLDRADREAGFLMFMPYALSLAVNVFKDLCQHLEREGDFIIPCTTDLRGTDVPEDKIFFNYCSMLFFRVGISGQQTPSELIPLLKSQFYNQCKENFPGHFENVMALMRILPVRVLDQIMCSSMKHLFGSFSFASLGESSIEDGTFLGIRVRNVSHMPHMPPQVGIGFIFNMFQGRINISVSFRENLLDKDAQEKLSSQLQMQVGFDE